MPSKIRLPIHGVALTKGTDSVIYRQSVCKYIFAISEIERPEAFSLLHDSLYSLSRQSPDTMLRAL